MIVFIKRIESEDFPLLYGLYKDVFSGYPWYEDLACVNCKTLYTNKKVKEESKGRVISLENFTICLKCKKPLQLISYYPDIIDQRPLINEAVNLEGFIGYIVTLEKRPIGFTWGYRIPSNRTTSVNFPEVTKLLIQRGIYPEQTFYGAETGIIESCQEKGLGGRLVALRSILAYNNGYKLFVNRTINPKMKRILKSLFSNIEPQELFKDPETRSPWFSYNFENFDLEKVKLTGIK